MIKKLLDRILREPVLVFAAIQAQILVLWPSMSDGGRLALAAWVALFQRALSTSRRSADEGVETAKYVGAVEHQATALAGQLGAALAPATEGG